MCKTSNERKDIHSDQYWWRYHRLKCPALSQSRENLNNLIGTTSNKINSTNPRDLLKQIKRNRSNICTCVCTHKTIKAAKNEPQNHFYKLMLLEENTATIRTTAFTNHQPKQRRPLNYSSDATLPYQCKTNFRYNLP